MNLVQQLEPARCTRKLSVEAVLAGKAPAGHIGETKEDDCRYLLHVNPFGDDKNVITSRRISKQTKRFVEKQDWCPFIRDYKFPKSMRGYVLDGGIYKKGLVSTDVVRAMRQGLGVSYVAWDVLFTPDFDLRGKTQFLRWGILHDEIAQHFPKWIHPSMLHDDPVALLKNVMAAKGEGIVLKDPEALYGSGWTKVKKKETFDVIIVGYNAPTSTIYAAKRWIGQIRCAQITHKSQRRMLGGPVNLDIGMISFPPDRDGYFFIEVANVKNMTDELRAKISAKPDKYIGRVLELSAQEQLKSGRLRNPAVVRVRDDKNAKDCILKIGDEA